MSETDDVMPTAAGTSIWAVDEFELLVAIPAGA
jgi:hypothetical protein